RYYFKPTFRSFYIFGGPAAAVGIEWGNHETFGGLGGFGIATGGGYQFSQHFQIELGAVLTSVFRTSIRTIHATVNLAGY
ncbi:MAG: hypothetical protein NT028_10810, partial [candidate division Zixibacteria bacterium]|nr:hypothetical protein [candidate division Zixibacteria bacterium]